jgi:hypothetical protein
VLLSDSREHLFPDPLTLFGPSQALENLSTLRREQARPHPPADGNPVGHGDHFKLLAAFL